MNNTDTFALVAIILHDVLSIDKQRITPETSFRADLELDSLDLVEFTSAVESVFDIEISDHRALRIHTVGDLVTFLEQHESGLDPV